MVNNNKWMGMLGLATKAGKIAFGTEASTECINKKKAKLVIVAEDSSDKTKKNFEFLCQKNNIPLLVFETVENLSKAIGNKNKAIICIKDKNFADEISKIICGGETIGKN